MLRPLEIPGFVPAAGIVARAASLLYPKRGVTVAGWAAESRVLNNPGGGYSGPWKHELAPWARRPMECLTDERFEMVAVMGPGQSAKSEIGNNWIGYTVCEDPASMIWCNADKQLMRAYVVEKVNPMIRLCDAIKERQLLTASADNIFAKEFRGCVVSFIHPVAAQFRMRSAPRGVLDDFDGIPEDIEGEGSAITLLGTRQTTFEGEDKTLVMSSPALGAKKGIEALVAGGTDERWSWACPECGGRFCPTYARDFRFDETGTAEQARDTAHVVAPCCGSVLEQRHKAAMQATGAYVAAAQTIAEDGTIEGTPRDSTTASFRFDGLIGFASWARLAHDQRTAQIAFETVGDELKLRAFMNTRAGMNFAAANDDKPPLTAEDLAAHEIGYTLGTVPPGVRVLTAAVDVQGNRFAVQVTGWGEGLQSWLVDRFDILQRSDGRTNIRPAQYPEHWNEILRRVISAQYPLAADPTVRVPILNTAIDTGGEDGVSDNATKFWHRARKLGVAHRAIMLVKGGTNRRAKLVPGPTYLEVDGRGRAKKYGAQLYVLNVHGLKDALDARLRRDRPGPLYVNLPEDLDAAYREELTAEERQDGVWIKVRPRNETLDLSLYNMAALMRWAGERADMAWIPSYAAVPVVAPATPDPQAEASAEAEIDDDDFAPPAPALVRTRGVRGQVRA